MDANTAVETCAALATDSRVNILRLLGKSGKGGVSSGDIAKELGVTQSTLSTQLFLLSKARLVLHRRESRNKIYSVNQDAIKELIGFLVDDCAGGRVKGVTIRA